VKAAAAASAIETEIVIAIAARDAKAAGVVSATETGTGIAASVVRAARGMASASDGRDRPAARAVPRPADAPPCGGKKLPPSRRGRLR
jgi:hypothetical protein